MKLTFNDILIMLREKFKEVNFPCIKAILLFGSMARGEASKKSDIDLLVLHENYDVEDPVIRRRNLYMVVSDLLGEYPGGITIIDMEFKNFIKPKVITPLLLNIYWDAKVVYDATGKIEGFLRHVRNRIVKSGLKRVRDGKAYYWILPKPMEEVRIL